MLRTGLLDPASAKREYLSRSQVHKTPIIDLDNGEATGPTGFLVEQAGGVTIRPHYHFNCQFQVFVRGAGLLGRRPVRPFTVQYVSAHTGYGPIVAQAEPLWYLTLRASALSGAHYLPDERAGLDMTVPKRQETSAPVDSSASAPSVQTCIAPEPNGLGAWMVSVPPLALMQAPRHPNGHGRYQLVVAGEAVVRDKHLPPMSLVWTDGADIDEPVRAGSKGLSAIVMQFPGDAT